MAPSRRAIRSSSADAPSGSLWAREAPARRRRRQRAVGRQLQGSRAGEPLAPPADLGLEPAAAQPLALPGRPVGILDGERREPRGAPGEDAVEGRQVGDQDLQRPAVRHDVVQGDRQQVLLGSEAEGDRAPEGAAGEVERRHRHLVGQAIGLRAGHPGGERREVDPGEVDRRRVRDLQRLSPQHPEDGAQRLVAAGHPGQGALQGREVEGAGEAHRPGQVVGRAPRRQAVEEPEAALGEGERQRAVGRAGHWQHRRPLPVGGRGDPLRQRRHRGIEEDAADRQVDAEQARHPRQQPRGEQRVAAEREEVVGRRHALDPEHLGDRPGEHLLDRGAEGRGGRWSRRLPGRGRIREGAPVDLAVGRQWQGVEADESGGDHVLRQALAQEAAQLGGGHPRRHHVGGQLLAAVAVLPRDHHRLAQPRMPRQRRLDLPQLDAEAADLHLVVEPPEVFEDAVRPPPGEVADAVEARAGVLARNGGERMGDELLRRQPGAAEIAARQPSARDVQLPRHPRRHRLAVGIEQVDPGVGHRPADRHRLARRQQRGGRVGGVLRRAVGVDDPRSWRRRGEPLDQRRRHRLAPQVDRPHPGGEPAGAHQLGHHRRRAADQLHLGRGGERGEGQQVLDDEDPPSPGERSEDLEHRNVEADRGRRQGPRQLLGREVLARPVHQHHRAAVLDGHRLGAARRSRGVDQVGEVGGVRHRSGILRALLAQIRVDGKPAFAALLLQPGGGRRLAEHHAGRRVVEDPLQPLARIGRIERHVGTPRLEHGEEGDDHPLAPAQADPHPVLRPHPRPPQPVGEPVGPRVELAVGEPRLPRHHRLGLRRARRLGLEELVQEETARPLRIPARRVVPGGEELPALGLGQQRQVPEGGVRRRQGPLHQRPQMAEHALRRAAVEEVGVELQRQAEPPLPVRGGEQAEVELRPALGEPHRFQLEASQRDPRPSLAE